MMKTERLVLGLALVAAGVFGSPSPQHLSGRSRPDALRPDVSVGVHSAASFAGSGAPSGEGGSEVQSACSDGAYVLNGHRWSKQYNWRFQASSRPNGFSASGTADAFRRAALNIVRGDNNCGLPDAISASQWYRGTTSRAPNISSGAGCLGRDGYNVVGFGTLPSGYLGMTCWWTYNGRIVETDVKLNKAYYRWYINRPSGCSYKWSIEAAATHEFGHAFGLGHVSEAQHPSLTMSPVIKACQESEKTLGLGDVVGLKALY
ncbi:MAG TPA: matrixin family metalloprotease [Actinomycetota bacterium]|jgi:hypothetical protein